MWYYYFPKEYKANVADTAVNDTKNIVKSLSNSYEDFFADTQPCQIVNQFEVVSYNPLTLAADHQIQLVLDKQQWIVNVNGEEDRSKDLFEFDCMKFKFSISLLYFIIPSEDTFSGMSPECVNVRSELLNIQWRPWQYTRLKCFRQEAREDFIEFFGTLAHNGDSVYLCLKAFDDQVEMSLQCKANIWDEILPYIV